MISGNEKVRRQQKNIVRRGGVSHLADCLTVRAIGIAVTSQIWPNLLALSSVIITTSLAAGVVVIGLGSS